MKASNIQYWRIVEAGSKKAFQDFNIDGQVIAPNYESDVGEQVSILKHALKQKPNALIVAPNQPSAVIPVLKEYKRKNIPVLLVDTQADWNGQTTFIGTDNYTLGEKSGELLASMLQPRNQVALIYTKIVNSDMIARMKGARDALEDAGIEIVTIRQVDNESGDAKLAMGNILETFPGIKGVFAATDTIATGALTEVKEKGIRIPVVGTDGTMNMVREVEEGTLSATLAQNPYDMGYLSVEQALKVIKGQPVQKRIDSGVDIIIRDNAKEKIDFLTTILK